ncbi:MAG: peptidyl-prolyl cis-trans isomerase [Candidatus Latescibacteria bacterium]|nr:peptidyl-prolyl cis-trans isomerase [Candidatus Latescibacterota bacterium]
MKIASCIVFVIVLVVAWAGCGRSDVTLARVGDEKITSMEFDQAWNELPQTHRDKGKKWLLETLINRKILTQEAKAMGLDRREVVRRELEKATMKKLTDELFQREVLGQVKVSEEEMRRYFEESGMDSVAEVRVGHIVVKTEEEAEQVVRKLHDGESFAQLAQRHSLDQKTASQGGDLGYLREGAAVGPVSEKAFSMEVGAVSEPIRDERGYYHLITVLEKRAVGFEQQEALIKNRVESGKIEKRRWEYMNRLVDELGLKVNDETLSFLLKRGRISIGKIPLLEPSEADRILLTYRGGSVPLRTYVEWLREGQAIRRRPNPVDSAQVVRFAQTRAITQVLFPEVARRQKLDREEAIRSYVERKKAEFMIGELSRLAVEATVLPEDTVRVYYKRHLDLYTQPERVFVEAVLTEDLQEGQAILEACRRGEDMVEVARRYPLRSSKKSGYRVFSFTPDTPDKEEVSLIRTELIRAAQDVPVGGWKGPVQLGTADDTSSTPSLRYAPSSLKALPLPYYTVLHVLERQASRIRGLDEPEVREEVMTTLRKVKHQEIEQAFEHFMTELQKRYEGRIKRYADNL